jgi:hypothetical protein
MPILLNLPGGPSAGWMAFVVPLIVFILSVKALQFTQQRAEQREKRKKEAYSVMEEINLN